MSIEFDNGLSPEQRERMALYVEEAGESLQVLGKINRHGLESKNPLKQDAITNKKALAKEIADVRIAIDLLTIAGDISEYDILDFQTQKLNKIKEWLHYEENKNLIDKLIDESFS